MKNTSTWAMVLAAAVALSGCGRSEPGAAGTVSTGDHGLSGTIHVGSLGISDGAITIHRSGYPDARILPDGHLTIDDREVPATEQQRGQLRDYYAAAMQLREHGKDTGIAGAKVGVAAAGAVVSGLLKGDTDSIEPKVRAQAAQVKESAGKVCDDIAAMRQAQDALAADMEAFRPYATLQESDVADCRDGLDGKG